MQIDLHLSNLTKRSNLTIRKNIKAKNQIMIPENLEHKHPLYSTGIKCKNYEVCGSDLPDYWPKEVGKCLCFQCHEMFGTWSSGDYRQTGKWELKFYDDIECPICFEIKRSVTYPNCDHTICVDCFKRCYFGDDDEDNRPKFPYPDILDEYEIDPNQRTNPRWDEYRYLIDIWDKQDDEWNDASQLKFMNEEHLRQCCICRTSVKK